MKFLLTIWVCSFIQGTNCSMPMIYPTMYDTWKECSETALSESLRIMQKTPAEYANKYKMGIKYHCEEVSTY